MNDMKKMGNRSNDTTKGRQQRSALLVLPRLMTIVIVTLFGIFNLATTALAWQQQSPQSHLMSVSRRKALQSTVVSIAGLVGFVSTSPTTAVAATKGATQDKLVNLPNEQLAARIASDIQDKQFLVTGQLSRELYDESATFTDEIDTYQLEQWTRGTQKLFVGNKSHVDLEPNSLQVSNSEVTFRFQETLCFNVPLLYPTVYLSGKVILQRDPSTGLITSYQEKWDQDVNTVLKSAKLFS
jgi:hypothetical protein